MSYNASLKFVIAGEGFPNKKAVEERARAKPKEMPVGDATNERGLRFLKGLFMLHPNPDKRIGEIEFACVLPNVVGPNEAFKSSAQTVRLRASLTGSASGP